MAIFTAIGASIFGAGTFLATVTAGALQVAASIGMSLIAKSMAGQPEPQRFGVQVRLQGGDDVPRSVLFGYCATSGSLTYANTWGTSNGVPNAYITQVIALADYPIRSLVGIDVNGLTATLGETPHASRGYPVLEYRKGGVDHMWVKFYDGTQTTADAFLTGTVSSTERPYESTRVGVGIPYAIVTCMAPERVDGDPKPLFQSGIPRIKFHVHGAKLYDPTDSEQDWDDPATWGGDGDFLPAVQIYNLLRGVYFDGTWLYGLQSLPAARLPDAWWQYQIEKCRTEINGPNGLEPTYRTGGEVQVGAQLKIANEAILTGCQGRLSEVGGVYKLHVGEPDDPVLSFSDDDIISTEEQHFTPFFGLEDSINGIQAKYPNPAIAWNTQTAPPLLRPDLEALDGNRRLLAEVSLDMVPYTGQVQRLMLSALREAQRARRHTLTMGPEFWVLEPGDYVEWTSERNGYITKLFRVDGVADQPNLDILLDLTEVDPSDYDWDQGADFRPVTDGPIQLVDTPALPMIGWQAYGVAVLDDLGRERRPGIEVWYQPGLQGVQYVRIQVSLPGEEDPFIDVLTNYGPPYRTQIAGNFPPNTEYDVRGIYVMLDPTAPTLWSEWLSVVTPDVKLIPGEDFDPYSGVTGFDQLAPDLDGYQNWIGQGVRQLIEQAEAQATITADQELANSLQFDEMRRSLTTTLGSLDARFEEVITTAILPMQGQLVAIADAVTSVSAGDGVDVNTARFRMTAMTGPTGYSRIGAETRQDTMDDWRGAAWYLDTPNDPDDPTRFLVVAEQFVVTDGTNLDTPLVFEGGVLSLNVANIGTVNAGIISGTNVTINLNTGFFSFGG